MGEYRIAEIGLPCKDKISTPRGKKPRCKVYEAGYHKFCEGCQQDGTRDIITDRAIYLVSEKRNLWEETP